MHLKRRAVVTLVALLAAVLPASALVTAGTAAATHYRATSITWATSGPNTAAFDAVISTRASYFGNPPVGSTLSEIGIDYGDGSFETPTFEVEFYDPTNDFLIARADFTHAYASAGPFTVTADSCCRLSAPLHINNPDGNNTVQTVVSFAGTSASPVTTVSPIVDCPTAGVCTFAIPATDPDGQPIRWRLAGPGDLGAILQPGPPYAPSTATVGATTGVYSWNTTGATLNPGGDSYYSTQVIVENVVGGVVVASTPVDFFIRLTDNASTNTAPFFVAPTPADGSTITGTVGQPLTFGVAAQDGDAGDVVTLSVLGLPSGATFTSSPANPASGVFSWTPIAVGSLPLTIIARDQLGLQALQRSGTLVISPAGTTPPGGTCGGRTPTLVGTAASETLTGTPGVDVIVGLGGKDKIYGLDGDDVVCAGDGNDTVYPGVGNDTVLGGAGNDAVFGAPGNDTLRGENGQDMVVGDAGNDTVDGGALIDKVSGGTGDDTVIGGTGVDECDGATGTNTLTGCEGPF